MACLVTVLIPGLMLYRHIWHGPLDAVAWFWAIGIVAFLLLAIACIHISVPGIYYRFSGVTLELVRGSKVLDQWELESSKVQVLEDKIIINGRLLMGLSPGGKAFRIIVQRLNHLAQQGNIEIEPQRTLACRKKLQIMIWAIAWFHVFVVTFVLMLAGITLGATLFMKLCYPEMPYRKISMALNCLLITIALYFSLAYATRKKTKILKTALFTFVGRIVGVEEDDASPSKDEPTETN